ncbi:MAG: metallophosphoesterase family protein [Thermodesulfobacteriota bacterium]
MKIGVVSDTHLMEPHSEFKKMIESYFKDVEKIFHAGDFVDWSIAEYLSSQKELVAVCGNMDSQGIGKTFPRKRIIELGGFKIGLIHGGGPPFGIESRIRGEFDEVDIIVYGHSHTPANHRVKNIYPVRRACGGDEDELILKRTQGLAPGKSLPLEGRSSSNGVLFFNPGSPTRSYLHKPTLGILHLGEKIEGEIIKIQN